MTLLLVVYNIPRIFEFDNNNNNYNSGIINNNNNNNTPNNNISNSINIKYNNNINNNNYILHGNNNTNFASISIGLVSNQMYNNININNNGNNNTINNNNNSTLSTTTKLSTPSIDQNSITNSHPISSSLASILWFNNNNNNNSNNNSNNSNNNNNNRNPFPMPTSTSLTTTATNSHYHQRNATTNFYSISSGLASNPLYNLLYENIAYCLVAFLLPLAILTFFNLKLILALKNAEKFRPKYPRSLNRSFQGGSSGGGGGGGGSGGDLFVIEPSHCQSSPLTIELSRCPSTAITDATVECGQCDIYHNLGDPLPEKCFKRSGTTQCGICLIAVVFNGETIQDSEFFARSMLLVRGCGSSFDSFGQFSKISATQHLYYDMNGRDRGNCGSAHNLFQYFPNVTGGPYVSQLMKEWNESSCE
ncbi:hypothetical protein HELRODRAFT_182972 [Helobdella robusta]|uniref:Uncharacterized protein n=1 Tax=Helobdella robusta TaxID=6412 RepID=T1FJ07_HELRO|nr:hypothetical protein HELRODRAFT_182972 [Helobdella robusta]ESN89963.1 hypothetical protein HELRODRAFT_182972 [Helobdella robusta]